MLQRAPNIRVSTLENLVANCQQWNRTNQGTELTFDSNTYQVVTADIPPNRTGVGFIAHDNREPLEIAADSRVFNFTYSDFGSNPIPKFGDTLTWHSNNYIATRVAPDDLADVTVGLRVFVYRKLIGDSTSVMPTKTYRLFTQNSMASATDGTTLNVSDPGYTQTTIAALINPMARSEKPIADIADISKTFGTAYIPSAILMDSYLVDPDTGQVWRCTEDTEYFPAIFLYQCAVEIIKVPPIGIS